jgi:hypothetical protein
MLGDGKADRRLARAVAPTTSFRQDLIRGEHRRTAADRRFCCNGAAIFGGAAVCRGVGGTGLSMNGDRLPSED